MAVTPVLQALLLADNVYIDSATGKKVIAGTFNHLAADEFPSVFDRKKCAFLSLTELRGEASVTLRFVDLSTGGILVEVTNLRLEHHDPLHTVEMVVEIPPLPLPHEGAYAFEAHCEGELLGSLRLMVSRRTERNA